MMPMPPPPRPSATAPRTLLSESDVGALILFTFTEPTDRALTGWGSSVLADWLIDALWASDPAAMMAGGEAA